MTNRQEYRNSSPLQLNTETRTVTGMAVVFNSDSENIGFIERIHPEAITDETIKRSDVLAKFNHDDNKVLARSKYGKGSLKLEVNSRGVSYEFESPKTALGDELLEYLNRGDISASSFAFTISKEEGAERWTKQNGIIYRDIYKIDKLYDVSPVFNPAYEATTCSKRFQDIQNLSNEIDAKMDLIKTEFENL